MCSTMCFTTMLAGKKNNNNQLVVHFTAYCIKYNMKNVKKM